MIQKDAPNMGEEKYSKEKPIPIDKDPTMFIPVIVIFSFIIHDAVEKSREGYLCSGYNHDCRKCKHSCIYKK